MSLGLMLALAGVAVLAAAIAAWIWVGRQRVAMETASGLAVLQPLRWKEFAQLVTRSFEGRGFQIEDARRQPGEDGVDYLLRRGNERHLLMIKHGGAYRVGPGPVRSVLSMLAAQGAQGGILVTSGRFDAAAAAAARGQPMTLVDGQTLWKQVQALLPTALLDEADRRTAESRAQAMRRVRLLALLGLTLLGAGAVARFAGLDTPPDSMQGRVAASDAPSPTAAPPGVGPAVHSTAAAPSTDAPARTTPGAGALRPAALDEGELEKQRNLAAAEALLVPGVAATRWESRSTLEIEILVDDDAARGQLIEQVCGRLLEREALRYSRIKILRFDGPKEAAPRWAQCR